MKLFPTEEKVLTLIFQAKTTYCGHCVGFSHIQQYRSNYHYVICRDCKKTTSILRETFLAKAHLDLRIWVYINMQHYMLDILRPIAGSCRS